MPFCLLFSPDSDMGIRNFQGPFIRTEEEEEDYMSPPWLMPMLRGNYFVPCSIHADSNKNECNLFCLDCAGNAFCSYCLVKHRDHRVVQVQYLSFFPRKNI